MSQPAIKTPIELVPTLLRAAALTLALGTVCGSLGGTFYAGYCLGYLQGWKESIGTDPFIRFPIIFPPGR